MIYYNSYVIKDVDDRVINEIMLDQAVEDKINNGRDGED